MTVAWEKLVVWILAIIVLLVIVGFLVANMDPNGTGIVANLFGNKETLLQNPAP